MCRDRAFIVVLESCCKYTAETLVALEFLC